MSAMNRVIQLPSSFPKKAFVAAVRGSNEDAH
jgi:hypothetical protein